MANAAALIDEGMWRRDKEFRALPRLAQCTYLQLLSQKDLDCAGILTLHIDLLAKGCDELDVEQLRFDLAALEGARFVFVDDDTDELLIRSYFRRVSVKSPNAYKSALRSAKLINSPKLRAELAAEMRRVGRKESDNVADEISPSEPLGNPVDNPSGTHSNGITHSEPPASVLVPVLGHLSSVGGQVGEAPPNEFCPKHPTGTTDSCRGCRSAREHREAWDAEQSLTVKRQRTEFWLAVRDCPECDENGHIDGPGNGLIRCPLHDWELIHA